MSSVVLELDNLLGEAPCPADGALLLVLQGLNNALPAVEMPAFGRTPVAHLISTDAAIQSSFLDGGSTSTHPFLSFHLWRQIVSYLLAEFFLRLPNPV